MSTLTDNDDLPNIHTSADSELLAQALDLCRKIHENPNDALLSERVQQWKKQSEAHRENWRKAQDYWSASANIRPQFAESGRLNRLMLALQIKFEIVRDAIGQKPLKRLPLPIAIACLILCAMLISRADLLSTHPDIQPLATGTSVSADHQTAWQQKRDIELDDGTIINLNWNTSVSVTLSPQQRHVKLHYGEAQFTVSPDKARPFTVETQGVYATAIGTQFMVRKSDSNEATITVSEGTVEVSSAITAAVQLKRNQQISSSATNPGEVLTVDADTLKSWQQGLLVFREYPLQEVLRELNRYTHFNIETGLISDTDRKVTGTYFTERADDALKLIALAFDLELEPQAENTVVVKSRRVKPLE